MDVAERDPARYITLGAWNPDEPVDVPWEDLWHIYAIANDKGGTGKTSLTANLALMLLKRLRESDPEARVLVIDLNAQGNLTIHEFDTPDDMNDRGAGILEALKRGTPLKPVNVRPGLDVIAGGAELKEDLNPLYNRLMQQYTLNADLRLLQCLLPIIDDYDFVIIDTPPENPTLQRLAMGAARWVISPSKSDRGSLDGVEEMRKQFVTARRVNPLLTLLGVVLFGTGRKSSQIHKRVEERLQEILGPSYFKFAQHIGHSEAVAVASRDLEGEPLVALFDRLDSGEVNLPDTVRAVHEDYWTLTEQIITRSGELQRQIEGS